MTDLWVCTDCLYVEQGIDTGDDGSKPDREPWGLVDGFWTVVLPGMPWAEHVSPACQDGQCECETVTYSTSPCDGCGSPLAGSRHAYTLKD